MSGDWVMYGVRVRLNYQAEKGKLRIYEKHDFPMGIDMEAWSLGFLIES